MGQKARIRQPAADKFVKDYVRVVTAEQLRARVTPLQSFIIARDQAYFKIVFFSDVGLVTWAKLK